MTDILFQGWTPLSDRVCVRCGGPNDCGLYLLCDDCRQDDEIHDGIPVQLDATELIELKGREADSQDLHNTIQDLIGSTYSL